VPYRIDYTEEARRAIRTMPGNYRHRARRLLEALADNPRPPGSKELRDLPGRYRIRLDRWRIIYRINDEDSIITVLRVGRKSGPETYHGLN
jgi:mRNA interferase RelE/StbE